MGSWLATKIFYLKWSGVHFFVCRSLCVYKLSERASECIFVQCHALIFPHSRHSFCIYIQQYNLACKLWRRKKTPKHQRAFQTHIKSRKMVKVHSNNAIAYILCWMFFSLFFVAIFVHSVDFMCFPFFESKFCVLVFCSVVNITSQHEIYTVRLSLVF